MKKKQQRIQFKSRQSLILACIILTCTLLSFSLTLLFPGIVRTFDSRFQDSLFSLRYTFYGRGRISPFIVHTVFNDATLEKRNLSLLDRKIYADLITALDNAGAELIAFDILFQHPGREPDDRLLVEAAREQGNTYFPLIIFPARAADSLPGLRPDQVWHPRVKQAGHPPSAGMVSIPFTSLADAARGLGHVNIIPDLDGVTRRFPLLFRYRDGYLPSLTFRQVCDYLEVNPSDIEIAFGRYIRLPQARFRGNLRKDIVIPVNNRGELRINYTAPWRDSFYEYGTEELLATLDDPALSARLRDEIEHSMVIVSDNSTRNNDTGTGVFDTVYPNSEIHVTVANMILTGEFIREPGPALSIVATLLCAGCLWFFSLRFRAGKLILYAVCIYTGYFLGSSLLFFAAQVLLQIVTVSLCFFLSLAGCTFYRFLLEEQALAVKKKENETLRIVDNLKTRFLYNITDDLQSPLSPVLSLSRDMEQNYRQYDEAKAKQALRHINDGAAALCAKIEELADLSKLDAGLLSLRCAEVRIMPFTQSIVNAFKAAAAEKDINLSFKAEAGELALWFDAQMMQKVLHNIIGNAVTFTGKRGRIGITVAKPAAYSDALYKWQRKTPRPAAVVQIDIKDTGAGIKQEYHDLIFQRFWKPPAEQETSQCGTGIGLALAKEYTELHGGHISVSSTPGEGSLFRVFLPTGKEHLAAGEIHAPENPADNITLLSGADETAAASGRKSKAKHPEKFIAIVNDDRKEAESWQLILRAHNITNTTIFNAPGPFTHSLAGCEPLLVLADHSLPRFSGFSLLKELGENYPQIPVIIAAGTHNLQTALQCIKAGAADYLFKPVDGNALAAGINHFIVLDRIREKRRQTGAQREKQAASHNSFSSIYTVNRKMKEIFGYIKRIAPTAEHILVRGETGVGKELIAQAIHLAGGRAGELIVVNTAGLDDTLFSDTLFGHTRGAFTGAEIKRDGLLVTAENGTIFLDEIGDLEIKSQIKLLRLLQSGDYYPLGSDRKKQTNARIVAATNADLEERVAQKIFREDLYYRLNPFEITLPPLRQRPEDIEVLIDHFLKKYATVFNYLAGDVIILPETNKLLLEYSYPGNVRQLENIIKAAVSNMKSNTLPHQHIREKMGFGSSPETPGAAKSRIFFAGRLPTLEEAEAFFIAEALKAAEENKTKAAQLLGITRFALNRKIKS